MGVRQDYLIWREKNGFFTALSTDGFLRTWSVASGKLLYRYKPSDKVSYLKNIDPGILKDYIVYQAADLQKQEDISWLMNFNNYPLRSHSIIRKK